MKATTGERIRLRRLQQGYSQENMADLLKLSTTAYGDIERGKTDLTLSRLTQVAAALHCTVPDLLTNEVMLTQAVEVVNPHETEMLRLLVEKQQFELEKLRLEAENRQRQYERSVARERMLLELVRSLESEQARERIGF